ncbi:MAG: GNAT family N-acetyltransferase, partial [Actinomycetota bacterium]
IEATYATAGVQRFAIWSHSSTPHVAKQLTAGGYLPDEVTYVMAMDLDTITTPDGPELDLVEPDFNEFLRINGLSPMFNSLPATADAAVYVARVEDHHAAALMSYEHEGDCGIFNVATLDFARRRGLGTKLTAHALERARERGCTTASLQSTEMGQSIYEKVGFQHIGAYTEYVQS